MPTSYKLNVQSSVKGLQILNDWRKKITLMNEGMYLDNEFSSANECLLITSSACPKSDPRKCCEVKENQTANDFRMNKMMGHF